MELGRRERFCRKGHVALVYDSEDEQDGWDCPGCQGNRSIAREAALIEQKEDLLLKVRDLEDEVYRLKRTCWKEFNYGADLAEIELSSAPKALFRQKNMFEEIPEKSLEVLKGDGVDQPDVVMFWEGYNAELARSKEGSYVEYKPVDMKGEPGC